MKLAVTVLVLIKSHTLEISFRYDLRNRVLSLAAARRASDARRRGTGAGCRVSRTDACLASSRHVESCKQSAEDTRWPLRKRHTSLGCMGRESDGMFRTLDAGVVHPAVQEEGQSEDFQAGKQSNRRRRGEGESPHCAEREL